MMFTITTYHHHRHHRHYHHHDGRILNTDKKFTFIGRRAVKVVHTGCQVAADFYDHDDDDHDDEKGQNDDANDNENDNDVLLLTFSSNRSSKE